MDEGQQARAAHLRVVGSAAMIPPDEGASGATSGAAITIDPDLATVPLGVPRPPTSLRPEAVYLASLEPSGRRSMRSRLAGVASLLGLPGLEAVPWERLRYRTTLRCAANSPRVG